MFPDEGDRLPLKQKAVAVFFYAFPHFCLFGLVSVFLSAVSAARSAASA